MDWETPIFWQRDPFFVSGPVVTITMPHSGTSISQGETREESRAAL